MTQHMKLLIKASVPAKSDHNPALVGNCKELGDWDPHHAVVMRKRNDGLYELEEPLNLHKGIVSLMQISTYSSN